MTNRTTEGGEGAAAPPAATTATTTAAGTPPSPSSPTKAAANRRQRPPSPPQNKKQVALPGDALAVSEEFLPGRNAYDASGTIRSLMAGTVVRDMSQREIDVKPVTTTKVPSVGDVVTGQIEAAQTSTANLKIYYLNGVPTLGGFVGTIFLREERGGGRGMRSTQVKLGDIVRAKVMSTLNGIIQLSIGESHLGVIASLCSNCGRPLRSGGNGRARCENCGNVEERKFADDFDRESIQP